LLQGWTTKNRLCIAGGYKSYFLPNNDHGRAPTSVLITGEGFGAFSAWGEGGAKRRFRETDHSKIAWFRG